MQQTMQLRRNELGFLKGVIMARLGGTGIHLNEEPENKREGKISYTRYQIRGIQTLIQLMVEDFYFRLIDNMHNSPRVSVDTLIQALKLLTTRYSVSEDLFEQGCRRFTDDTIFWSSMDNLQRFSLIISAFFEALDETCLQMAECAIKIVSNLFLKSGKEKTFPKLVGNLGFVWRAREYATIFNKLCDGGFSNTISRVNQALLAEYQQQLRLHAEEQEKTTEKTLPPEMEQYTSRLQSTSPQEVLEAITSLKKYGPQVIGSLETLLSHSNEEIANKALDAILELKNERIDA